MAYFSFVSTSRIMDANVVSLPVPAVVGTAIKRGMGFSTLRIPPFCLNVFLG